MLRIALDVMGGDGGPAVTLPAALSTLRRHPEVALLLAGPASRLEKELGSWPETLRSRVETVDTPGRIEGRDRPETVLRGKRDSSLFRAIELLSQQRADACVSAGNTGALLLAGRHLLKPLPGIRKPAMIASLPVPSSTSRCYLLDVGANVCSDAEQLLQFAIMGTVLASIVDGRDRPRVGLLNIGAEEHKGSVQVREAAGLLEASPWLDYVGFVEGNRLFSGDVDVLVCDGVTGNITIKTSAGTVSAMEQIIEVCSRDNRLLGRLAAPLLRRVRRQMNPARYNGASLLGLQGSIIKSHGNAGVQGFNTAIEQAIDHARSDLPGQIAGRIDSVLTRQKQEQE